MDRPELIACHECDALHQVTPLAQGGAARCVRCGALLYRRTRNSLERTLALTLAGLILFVVANSYPLLAMRMQAQVQQATLMAGIRELYFQGMWAVAFLVLMTTVVIPLSYLAGMLFVLLPLRFNRSPRHLPRIFGLARAIQGWSMMEVFLIGLLVAIVKLAKMATIVPGPALYALAALILVMAGSLATLDERLIWNSMKARA
ncbi:MAG: paraquat-inducible protein A [Thermodesulfobacteriota bacterium]